MIRCRQCNVNREEDLFINKQTGRTTLNCEKCRETAARSAKKRNGGKYYGDKRRDSNFRALYGEFYDAYDDDPPLSNSQIAWFQQFP